MELPIYQENLRSSGNWRAGLASVRIQWQNLQSDQAALKRVHNLQSQFSNESVTPENFLAAAQLITQWAKLPDTTLTVARIIELNQTLASQSQIFREAAAIPLNEAHDPPLALLIPRLLDNAMEWFASEGFAEMNAVEQAALVFLRLLDLQPFAEKNFVTANLAANFYTERAGLPPLIFDATDAEFQAALDSSFKMLTQHLVDFFATTLTNIFSKIEDSESNANF